VHFLEGEIEEFRLIGRRETGEQAELLFERLETGDLLVILQGLALQLLLDALFGIADYSWQLLPDGSWERLPPDGTGGTQLALIRRARRSSTAQAARP